VGLAEVFIAMRESKIELPDLKDNKAVKKYFDTVYPNLDFDRVYSSDMKKMIKWFEVLETNKVDYTVKRETEEQQDEETVAEPAQPKQWQQTKQKQKQNQAAPPEVKEVEDDKPKQDSPKEKRQRK
jgi:hypothetical protein